MNATPVTLPTDIECMTGGAWVAKRRHELNLTCQDVADLMQAHGHPMGFHQIYNIQSNQRGVSPKELVSLLDSLDTKTLPPNVIFKEVTEDYRASRSVSDKKKYAYIHDKKVKSTSKADARPQVQGDDPKNASIERVVRLLSLPQVNAEDVEEMISVLRDKLKDRAMKRLEQEFEV